MLLIENKVIKRISEHIEPINFCFLHVPHLSEFWNILFGLRSFDSDLIYVWISEHSYPNTKVFHLGYILLCKECFLWDYNCSQHQARNRGSRGMLPHLRLFQTPPVLHTFGITSTNSSFYWILLSIYLNPSLLIGTLFFPIQIDFKNSLL